MFFNSKIPKLQPNRIVSLVPSLTELLVDLNQKDKIVGITKFCVHPKELKKEKTIIGGTKNPNIEKIKSLQPDFILANDEENNLIDVEQLAQFCPVYVTSIKNISDNNQTIFALGELLHAKTEANHLVNQIENERIRFHQIMANKPYKKGLYLIWKAPYMSIGHDTFIHAMLSEMKIDNVFGNQTRYPSFELKNFEIKPDVILLSSEPYPFKQKDIDFFQKQFPNAKVLLVDGEYFSWYGSRVVGAFRYFEVLGEKV